MKKSRELTRPNPQRLACGSGRPFACSEHVQNQSDDLRISRILFRNPQGKAHGRGECRQIDRLAKFDRHAKPQAAERHRPVLRLAPQFPRDRLQSRWSVGDPHRRTGFVPLLPAWTGTAKRLDLTVREELLIGRSSQRGWVHKIARFKK